MSCSLLSLHLASMQKSMSSAAGGADRAGNSYAFAAEYIRDEQQGQQSWQEPAGRC